MEQRTRKLTIIYMALHPRDDVDRLYVSRKEGRKGLNSIEDSFDASIQQLEHYKGKHNGEPISAIRIEISNTITNRTIDRKPKWEEKQLYGHFKRLINKI